MRQRDIKTADTLYEWADELSRAGNRLRNVAHALEEGLSTKDQSYKEVLDTLSEVNQLAEESKKLC